VAATATRPKLAPTAARPIPDQPSSDCVLVSVAWSLDPTAAIDRPHGARAEGGEGKPHGEGSDAHTIAPAPVGMDGLSLGNATCGPLASVHSARTLGSDQARGLALRVPVIPIAVVRRPPSAATLVVAATIASVALDGLRNRRDSKHKKLATRRDPQGHHPANHAAALARADAAELISAGVAASDAGVTAGWP